MLSSSAIPWRSGTFYVILSCSLMGVMGVSLISPVLPEIRTAFGVSDAQIGLVITAYTLPGVLLTPFVGLVADRIGRRRTIIPLLFLFGISGISIAFVSSFAVLLGLRFLQGVGASALITLAVTLIGDFYDGQRQDAVIGVNGSMSGSGAAVYPLLGGLLAGIHWNVPFLVYGVGVVVGLVALVSLPEPAGRESSSVRTYLSQLRAVVVHPEAIVIFSVVLVAFFVFYGAVQTALPLLLSSEYGLASGEIGMILALTAVATAAVASQYGWLSRWRTANELLALGFVAYGVGLVGVWAAPSPAAVGAALLVFGAGFGVVMPAVDTAVVTLVSARLRAGMTGMRTSVIRVGQTIGPVAFTVLAEAAFDVPMAGYRTLILVCGVALLCLGIGGYAFLRR